VVDASKWAQLWGQAAKIDYGCRRKRASRAFL
jgi:hypothetical protein